MPDIAYAMLVIFGFLTAALILRALATAGQRPARVRAGRPELSAHRAVLDK
ncbi:hypothetical protein [Nocardia sp. NPDC005978]|uniref:hypothetical protein n=1 Tax=unclassified Nocardia TaxID=2637762 RepID=UPI0033A0301B